MDKEKRKKIIKLSISIAIIVLIIATALFMAIKYEVEGEKNMPYNLSKIIIISSAVTSDAKEEENVSNTNEQQETQNEETQTTEATNTETPPAEEQTEENYIWDEKVIQTNDVYIYLTKNENYKEEASIKGVRIENIQVLKKVNIGKIQIYMPNSKDDELYKYINEYLIGSTLTYTGGAIDNKKTLEICNKGGAVCLSFANVDLGRYKSNEDEQIEQGAYILEKMNLTNEDLQFKVKFDLIIDVGNKAYKGTITLDMPVDGVVGQKETHVEITDFSNVIFKRHRN